MWWPHPDSFDDLTVTESEDGWVLSAPDDSELGDWIFYWSQSEEHHRFFEREFISSLLAHATKIEQQQHGKTEVIPDE